MNVFEIKARREPEAVDVSIRNGNAKIEKLAYLVRKVFMSNVINLTNYRRKKQREWLKQHHTLLENFIFAFLHHHLSQSFSQLNDSYQFIKRMENEMTWNYEELRDLIHEGLNHYIKDSLYEELKATEWFDDTLINKEEVVDHCVSLYIRGAS